MEKRIIEPIPVYTTRLVKSEDLNHHGTLFAGRTAEWFVESGFISAASILNPKEVVCMKIHGMSFSRPARPGEILRFSAKIVYAGKSSLISFVEVLKSDSDIPFVSGFLTFIHVDEQSNPSPHGIEINAVSDNDKKLQEQAKLLKKK